MPCWKLRTTWSAFSTQRSSGSVRITERPTHPMIIHWQDFSDEMALFPPLAISDRLVRRQLQCLSARGSDVCECSIAFHGVHGSRPLFIHHVEKFPGTIKGHAKRS